MLQIFPNSVQDIAIDFSECVYMEYEKHWARFFLWRDVKIRFHAFSLPLTRCWWWLVRSVDTGSHLFLCLYSNWATYETLQGALARVHVGNYTCMFKPTTSYFGNYLWHHSFNSSKQGGSSKLEKPSAFCSWQLWNREGAITSSKEFGLSSYSFVRYYPALLSKKSRVVSTPF